MIDLPILWQSFIHGIRDMLTAVRLMPNWVYGLMVIAVAIADLLAIGVVR